MMEPKITLEKEINALLDDVVLMGSRVESAIIESVRVLKERDHVGAKKLYKADKELNKLRYELENRAIGLIALHQPVARDVRTLAAVLEIITELERMADYAKGISRISRLIGDEPFIKPLVDLPRMAELAADMLNRALKAFVDLDEEAARKIPKEDDQVDDLFNQVYRELITHMIEDNHKINQANYLLWVAHNLERCADRVTNVCERTIYIITGELGDWDPTDDEMGMAEE
jgi:phosphate transport system protein